MVRMLLSGGEQSSKETFFTTVFSPGAAVMVSVGLVLRLRHMLLYLPWRHTAQSTSAVGA